MYKHTYIFNSLGLIFVAGYSIYSSRAHYSFELRRREFEELDRKVKSIDAVLSSPQWYEATEKKIMNSKVNDGRTLQNEIQTLLSLSSSDAKITSSSSSSSLETLHLNSKSSPSHSSLSNTVSSKVIDGQSSGINSRAEEKDSEKSKKKSSYNIKL